MKILIELPTWIGDAVMASPSIENIVRYFPESRLYFLGPTSSSEIFRNHPKFIKTFKASKSYIDMYRLIRSMEYFEYFFSFRSSKRTSFLKLFINSKYKFQFNKNTFNQGHQVERYNNFINSSLDIHSLPGDLKIYKPSNKIREISNSIGINPGASYGSAKRWYPEEFAKVAISLSKKYDIYIFGGLLEVQICKDIEKILLENKVKNFSNLAGKTSISELIELISKMSLFITGDSGSMHIAAAFKIPTITIFGPTNFLETSQWNNSESYNLHKKLDCQPCMKRDCPLGHHNCMKLIKADDVLKIIDQDFDQ